jgi:hypothetical protein
MVVQSGMLKDMIGNSELFEANRFKDDIVFKSKDSSITVAHIDMIPDIDSSPIVEGSRWRAKIPRSRSSLEKEGSRIASSAPPSTSFSVLLRRPPWRRRDSRANFTQALHHRGSDVWEVIGDAAAPYSLEMEGYVTYVVYSVPIFPVPLLPPYTPTRANCGSWGEGGSASSTLISCRCVRETNPAMSQISRR